MVLWLALVVPTASAKRPPSSEWDTAATEELKAANEKMFADIDAGNLDAVVARMSQDGVLFDVDPHDAPVSKRGTAEIAGYLRDVVSKMKAAGGTVKTIVVRDDCFATAVMGYCAVEFDQTFTTEASTLGPLKFRGTTVARNVGGEWVVDHWHGSYREAPTGKPPAIQAPSQK